METADYVKIAGSNRRQRREIKIKEADLLKTRNSENSITFTRRMKNQLLYPLKNKNKKRKEIEQIYSIR